MNKNTIDYDSLLKEFKEEKEIQKLEYIEPLKTDSDIELLEKVYKVEEN